MRTKVEPEQRDETVLVEAQEEALMRSVRVAGGDNYELLKIRNIVKRIEASETQLANARAELKELWDYQIEVEDPNHEAIQRLSAENLGHSRGLFCRAQAWRLLVAACCPSCGASKRPAPEHQAWIKGG
ncbi:MAG: hypothetical protein WC718_14925 [Phycisphaerales bacterium]|jgi:hypothetical protein